MKKMILFMTLLFTVMLSCGSRQGGGETAKVEDIDSVKIVFDADSAYEYVARQVSFGPRVPNSESHRQCGEWLAGELRKYGAEVSEQRMQLRAFDGTMLNAVNIIGSYNPELGDRLLLLAHWDSRPWADADADESNHNRPVDGANDGASGVGVLLEIARQISIHSIDKGVDILFVDAEDWGTDGDDQSWAMGSRYFANNPYKEGYRPANAILLDMVGGENAIFRKEYFSISYAPQLVNKVWSVAMESGYGDKFVSEIGGAVTDDHIELLNVGIPAINIIEFHPQTGFNPTWHTVNDNMDHISKESLKAVGQTVLNYLYLDK